jgi:hypothetical protein
MTDEGRLDIDIVGRVPYHQANSVEKTYLSKNISSITASATLHWLLFLGCSVFKKPNVKNIDFSNQVEHKCMEY